MHYQQLVALLLAAGSEVVLASVSSTVINGNNNSASTTASTKLSKPRRRDLESLYRRDPEFVHAMQLLARTTRAAKDVDGMVADIKAGKTPAPLVAAATERGLVKNVQGFQGKNNGNRNARPQLKNGAAPKVKRASKGKGTISGPRGQVHSTAKVVSHVQSKFPTFQFLVRLLNIHQPLAVISHLRSIKPFKTAKNSWLLDNFPAILLLHH